ncbi:hypothetical protein BH11ACT8_BH11ACT8_05050 [soil metagenome]
MTTEERIAQLESQITELDLKQAELHQQLMKSQVDQWQARFDDLQVQLHLGAMETNEHLTSLVEQLRRRWSTARKQMEGASATATEVGDTLRVGLESAFGEIRTALLASKEKVSH